VKDEQNVRVIRSYHFISKRSTPLSRFWENVSFGLSSSLQLVIELITHGKPDVAFMKTWWIFAQNMNSLILKLWRIPIVATVLDIYPESLTEKGIINSRNVLSRIMFWLDRFHLRRCCYITTLSPGMAEYLTKTRFLPQEKVHVVPNYIDETAFNSPIDPNEFRRLHNIPSDTFVAMFAGTLTLSAGLMMYIEVAKLIQDRSDIKLMLVGDGSLRKQLEQEIKKNKLTNIQVISPLLPEQVPVVQAGADVMLLSLAGNMAVSAVPSKLVYYMVSAKPTIASVNGLNEAARIIREANAGFVLPPEDPVAVANLLRELPERRRELNQLGLNGRHYALENFTAQKVIPKLASLIEGAAR